MIVSERKPFNPAEDTDINSISIDSTGLQHIECAFYFQLSIRLECTSKENRHFWGLGQIAELIKASSL